MRNMPSLSGRDLTENVDQQHSAAMVIVGGWRVKATCVSIHYAFIA
ncbi:hypothetical protein [Paenibacillus spongiae]|nr:hypothetical protein [Paenibacillus spongiae]